MSTVLEYKLPDETQVLAEDVVWKMLTKYLFSETDDTQEEDPDIKVAMLIARAILESEENTVVTGMYLINPEIVNTLAALVYAGLKHKTVELQNNLTLVVPVQEESALESISKSNSN